MCMSLPVSEQANKLSTCLQAGFAEPCWRASLSTPQALIKALLRPILQSEGALSNLTDPHALPDVYALFLCSHTAQPNT